MKKYDIAVIGAGPAGSMLCKLLTGKGLKIALIDKRDFNKQGKSCGGLLAPDAQKFLQRHQIKLPETVKVSPQLNKVRTVDLKTGQIRYYKRNYINIDRLAFEKYLHKGLSCDTYFKMPVHTVTEEKDGFTLNAKIKAKIIVGADGGASKIRSQFFKGIKLKEYVAAQEFFKAQETPLYECFFDGGLTDYYGWTLVKNGIKQIGIAIPKGKDAAKVFKTFKNRVGTEKQTPIGKDGAVIVRPKAFHPVPCRENIFLIGEAGGYISPSSAEGLSYAFKTAEVLAKSEFSTKTFKRKMRRIQINLLYKNLKALAIYTPWIRRLILSLTLKRH